MDQKRLAKFVAAGLSHQVIARSFGVTQERLKQELERPELAAVLKEAATKRLETEIDTDSSLELAERALIKGIITGSANPHETLAAKAKALETITKLIGEKAARKQRDPELQGGKGTSIGLRLLVTQQIAAQLDVQRTSTNEIIGIGGMMMHPMSFEGVKEIIDGQAAIQTSEFDSSAARIGRSTGESAEETDL